MPGWYFSVGGRAAEGPVSDEFILEGLTAGRLTLVDLVFREGDAGWSTIGEVENFKAAVVNQSKVSAQRSPEVSKDPDDSWIVLKKTGDEFTQNGPYTAESILAALGRGDVLYSEHAWKPGFQRWVRIGDLLEFDRRRIDRELDASVQMIPVPSVDEFAQKGENTDEPAANESTANESDHPAATGESATAVTEMIASSSRAAASANNKKKAGTPSSRDKKSK